MDQSEIPRDVVIARYFELDAEITRIATEQKAALAPLVEEQKMCALYVKETMLKNNEQQVKIAGVGSTNFTTKTSCAVRDFDAVVHTVLSAAPIPPYLESMGVTPEVWQATLDHIQANGLWTLLTKAVSKETAKEYVEIHNEPPPGVELSTYRDLAWSRAKTK